MRVAQVEQPPAAKATRCEGHNTKLLCKECLLQHVWDMTQPKLFCAQMTCPTYTGQRAKGAVDSSLELSTCSSNKTARVLTDWGAL
eukprot:3693780-Amphidinium_carterae.1